MAYAKKVTRGRYRSSRYRRRAWRRRYRRNKYRRYYRRTRRRAKVEYKRIEFNDDISFKGNLATWASSFGPLGVFYISPEYYYACGIGCSISSRGIEITQGTKQSQRIGAKITPITLRIFGTMSITNKTQTYQTSDNSTGLKHVPSVNVVMVRMIVFQVRNGSIGFGANAFSSDFSSVNPYVTDRLQNDPSKGVLNYNNQSMTSFLDPDWFWRMFAIEKYTSKVETPNTNTVIQYVEGAARMKQGVLAKAPYRNGIGSAVKILKNKLYYLRPETSPSFAFRTKVKRMNRMVWPESPLGLDEDEITRDPRNPIYITFIPIFPESLSLSQIDISYYAQLYYLDK